MPIASRSGSHRASRRSWRGCDRAGSRLGPRSRPRRSPLTQLALALQALIRFHEAHPDWFPPQADPQPPLPPGWEAAIAQAYGSPSELDHGKNALKR